MFTTLRGPLPESRHAAACLFTTNPGGPRTMPSLIGSISAASRKVRGRAIVDAKTGETRRYSLSRSTTTAVQPHDAELHGQHRTSLRRQRTDAAGVPLRQLVDIIAGGALDNVFFKHGKTIFVEDFEIPAVATRSHAYDHGQHEARMPGSRLPRATAPL